MIFLAVKFSRKKRKITQGFTLLEMILVIMILGIMAVGISGFISLSTQTYINATARDELVGNARFVIERLSRELRNALPNSIRVKNFNAGQGQCLQFTPIIASTVYTDIPVMPEPASNSLSIIPFNNNEGDSFQCDTVSNCNALATVYPLSTDDIYADSTAALGKTFQVESVTDNIVFGTAVDLSEIILNQAINFIEDSPTKRLYIINDQVSYCVTSGFISRYQENIASGNQIAPPVSSSTLMAGYLTTNFNGHLPFNYQPATLRRNAVVQIHLKFTQDDESYVFDHEVHINNVP
ncbi:type II secretion system protein [Colwellia sp. E2M01]|uniref:type II secretion system protein n=1 Tax=Colwellia sp. E2M01 TaxID=2841561 RepID=UPI001C089181|nr:type II secretion system protein [Colwellia sp. E2M01]MBU2870300.1 type II secretion system GspH family protein [Colwellia sp. E2M01]